MEDLSETSSRLTAVFGPGIQVSDEDTPEVQTVWLVGQIEVALTRRVRDRRLRAVWRARQGNRAVPLLLLVDSPDGTRTLGPQTADEPIRSVSFEALIRALQEAAGKSRREAAAYLVDAFERRDRTGIPGVIIRGLLTKHVLTRRLRKYRADDWRRLQEIAGRVRPGRDWRENLTALGYRAEELKPRGYLLRHEERPVAVVLPLPDSGAFSRTTDEGQLPEGLLVADCRKEGVSWGLLAAKDRFRLFPAQTTVGAATGRYLELDITETEPDDWPYVGLLAPECLEPGGLLEQLVEESVSLGNDLRDTIEQQIRDHVLLAVARGLGDYVTGAPRKEDLASPNTRKWIEQAALLLMFRVLFFLYLESREFLPRSSSAYRPHSATQLLADARAQAPSFDERATLLWDRFATLVKAMRTGSTAWGIPAYNGDLFASDVLVGAELLEEATLPDIAFGPALAALAFDPEGEEGAGVDYGDLEIAHLGRIYEGLLSLKLSLADLPLVYDTKTERWMPTGRGQEPEIEPGQLFYQTESGGRKAAGVYYTPQVIVRHLVDRAVLPALNAHLEHVAEVAKKNVNEAATLLFDFRVVDPAMGSAHFLADALDRIAERIGTFLADRPLKPVIAMLDGLRAEAKWEGRIEDGDLFRRLVLKRCIYGVDVSDMAVEVAKVSLWLTSFVPGLSLAYLGHNLRQGDALVGVADPAVLADLGPMFAELEEAPIPKALTRAREFAERIAEMPDRTPDEVAASRHLEGELNEVTGGLVRAFDVWCSEPFGASGARDWLTGAAEKVLQGEPARLEEKFLHPALDMARDRSFFHWAAEFPEIFARQDPGFDVVVGNPPWEEPRVHTLDFYALHDPGLRAIRSEAERQERIDSLVSRYAYLEQELLRQQQYVIDSRRFYTPAGGYVAQAGGHADVYKVFCERYRALTRYGGSMGVVLPRAAFLNVGLRGFRRWLFTSAEIRRLDFILNNRSWAFPIHPQYTIALLTAQRMEAPSLAVMRTTGPSASQEGFVRASLSDGVPVPLSNLANWTATDGEPGWEVPLFPGHKAVEVFDKLRTGPRFDHGYPGIWAAFPLQGDFNETSQRHFLQHEDGWPVWKGKCFYLLDPHGRDPAGVAEVAIVSPWLQQRRTAPRSAFRSRFDPDVLERWETHPAHAPRIAFRDISRATDSRTVIASLVPGGLFLTDSAPYLVFYQGGPMEQAFVLGVMTSLPFDWQARRLVETHVTFFLLEMLSFPPAGNTDMEAIASRAARLSCIDERFADFAEACGVEHGPIEVNERLGLMSEVDALVAHAFDLTKEDLNVVFSDFTEAAVPAQYRDLVQTAFDAVTP